MLASKILFRESLFARDHFISEIVSFSEKLRVRISLSEDDGMAESFTLPDLLLQITSFFNCLKINGNKRSNSRGIL